MREATPAELAPQLADGDHEQATLIDVREVWELNICALPGFQHIPMQQIPARIAELDPARQTIVLCHHGIRSRVVCQFLEQNGFTDVVNIDGGIDRWAKEVDPGLGLY